MSQKPAGIKQSTFERLEALKEHKLEPGVFVSDYLLNEMAFITQDSGREVCVYISRGGNVLWTSIGEKDRVSLEKMTMRRSEERLCSLRCIHTHPGGNDTLSSVDIQSLKSLRLDAMAAVGVKDGKAGYVSVAFLSVEEGGENKGELLPRYMRAPSWDIPHSLWLEAISQADKDIVKSVTHDTGATKERVMLLGHEDLSELEALAFTAGGEVCAKIVQKGKALGEGKIREAALVAQASGAHLAVYDGELTPSGQRELETALGIPVLDRTALILDIFAMRAQSGEGQLQVELAQCKYALSRLTGMGAQLSRQGGGIGTRGPGEKRLETDRRHLKRREAELEKQLEQLSSHRGLMRKKRKRSGMPLISLVGYTNAGKSTLLNALTGADAFCENKLFATLDPLTRTCELPDGSQVLITDTVGFVRRLPHLLVEAFRSTLEEASQSDLLLHVCDASDPELTEHIIACEQVLEQIGGAEIPRIMVLNKVDKTDGPPLYKDSVCISAVSGQGLEELKDKILHLLNDSMHTARLDVPYSRGDVVALIHKLCKESETEYASEYAKITFTASAENIAKITAVLNKK